MNRWKNYLKTFREFLSISKYGDKLSDKFAIFYYTLKTPVYTIMKHLGINHNRLLLKDVTLNYGTYKMSCGRYIANVVMASPTFESWMYSYMDKVKDGTFIDVGSNIGKYAIYVGSRLKGKGKVLAIEAESANFTKLKDSVALNKLQETVIPIQIAASNKQGYTEFYLDNIWDGGTHSTLKSPFLDKKNTGRNLTFTEIVPTDTIDNLVEMLKLKNVRLMKIDIEGAEAIALSGAVNTIKRDHPDIIFEAWRGDYFQKVADVLKPLGYKFTLIDGRENESENWLASYGGKK